MAQLIPIQLSRYDAQPWGFRLQGGKDFGTPLVVQKVNSGSLSEQAGLLPGDAVIKINDVDVYTLRHKDAQDIVVRSGNNFTVTVQRGGSTWRPSVTPTGQVPSPRPQLGNNPAAVTKTSLAHNPQEVQHIGSGYNNSARPFNSVNGNDGPVKSIVNKQYNTPVGIYSEESIAETLSAQAEVLAGGVLGVNFKKNEKAYNADKSEVLKFLLEEENSQAEPEPHCPANFYWTQSHAIGGRKSPKPRTPHSDDERIGTPLQQNTLAPAAPHRPSLPSTQQSVCPALGGIRSEAQADHRPHAGEGGSETPSNLPACSSCGAGIAGVFVRIKDKNLHVECFKCATCGTSLKNQGYFNFNNKLYCDIHAKLAATQNPPSGTDGYSAVPIKPNTKLSASTISAAINSHGHQGFPAQAPATNGNGYHAPSVNTQNQDSTDLPLPPPPTQFELQQDMIMSHSRTNSSLSSSSSYLSPYSSMNGINHHNSSSTLSLEKFPSPSHSRQHSSSSSGNGITRSTSPESFLPPPPPPLPLQSQKSTFTLTQNQNQQKYLPTALHHQTHTQTQPENNSIKNTKNISMTINQQSKQNENDMNSNNRNGAENASATGGALPTQANANGDVESIYGSIQPNPNDTFQYVTLNGNVIRSVIPPGKGVQTNYRVNQPFARPFGAAPVNPQPAGPKSPASYPPPTQTQTQAPAWTQPKPVVQAPAYATLPRSNVGTHELLTNEKAQPDPTELLAKTIGRVKVGNKSAFMNEAGKIITTMLENRLANNNNNNTNTLSKKDSKVASAVGKLPQKTDIKNETVFDALPMKPFPPSVPVDLKHAKISAGNDACTELKPLETVIFRNKNSNPNTRRHLTHASDRRSYIEKDEPVEQIVESSDPVEIETTDLDIDIDIPKEVGEEKTRAVVGQLLKDGKRPICCDCNKEITSGPFITALGRIWCPEHFICVNVNCRRPLQDIGFVEEKGDLYCEYCFEKFLAPSCSKCNGKIKGDCLNAIGKHFHPECFTCCYCGKLFGNTPFFLEEGEPYCEADWNELFTTKCFACGFPVEAGDRWVEALNHNYHSQCFNCTMCKKNLEGQSFYNKGGRPFCKNHAR